MHIVDDVVDDIVVVLDVGIGDIGHIAVARIDIVDIARVDIIDDSCGKSSIFARCQHSHVVASV